ncbi:acyltransferase family protein [Staphylococcus pseudoxylosus]|uniref:Acetyltransferase n=1 Tax=Staphylococcus pseudoxylosus TaxID=2282419 RepID=A0AAQ0MJX4_9STAP|nr:acyltransferase family protein [Staphylococcus pseudoxylosus]PTI82164.1 acyltransferase [Staphylococcus xylosus]MCE5001655.1 acetyltransferase [Staphylococcus pseudoxylosus]MEB5784073.1 acetyltransferase [Staphylococcus pseudoxylosus]MEB6332410.1 acetyltransferase [Staphylococcus pseudoxylosus]RMI85683.1 acetyltransferase [Staphylococcus pseudoxylosus]
MNNNLNKHKQLKYSTRYMPGLDGLRAIAVIGIIIYHLNKQWLTGGFLGVDTFFVISGYLITSLLLFEYESTGIINLKQFWLRRIKRLIPAMLVLVMVVTVATLIFKPAEIVNIKQDAFAAIFYVSNWWYIATDVNYFEQFAFMPLKHLWSLAIEEQFYIIFPIVFILLLLIIKKYRNVTLILWIISLVSLLTMIIIGQAQTGHSRVYFGTDTRLQTMLLGVIFAFVWPPFKLKKNPNHILRTIIDSIGVVGIALLLMLFFIVNDDSNWIYNGGFYLISGLTLFVIMSAVHPSGYFAKILGNPLFIYIGKRSYSLYLWHFPVISFIHSYYVDGQLPVYVYVVDIILTIILSEMSYRYIETPFRKRGMQVFSISRVNKQAVIRLIVLILFLISTIFVFAGSFDKLGKNDINDKATSYNTDNIDKYLVRPIPVDDVNFLGDSDFKKDKDNEVYADLKPLLIGDSVMVDIGETFKMQVPHANIDGQVGRNLYEAIPLVDQKYQNYNQKSDQVILELGTNGDFSEEQLNELIKKFGEAQVYLVNTRVPRSYESHVNELMADAAKKHDNVTLIDWHKRSEGHSEYFAPDGIHLENAGIKAMTDEILKHIAKKSK